MQIIPVIDLQKGIVVRGVAGDRGRYLPVSSVLTDDPRPRSVARALVTATGAHEMYVADLDAIAGAEPAWDAYHEIAEAGAAMLIDAGIRGLLDARPIVQFASQWPFISGIIAALESSDGADELSDVFARVGVDLGIFSLDLKQGRPITSTPTWADQSAEQIVELAVRIGFRRLIVLDVARVGIAEGLGTLPLCKKLRARYPHLEIITGGGIRHTADLTRLARSGCDAALVASALHSGELNSRDLRHCR